MELNDEDLKSIFPCNNNVILRPILDTKRTQGRGVSLHIDTTWLPEHHSRVLCEVVALPMQLIFHKKHQEYSMEWDTEMNLKIGETVMINYLGALDAEKYYYFKHNGEKLYIVPYARIYMVLRGDDVIMLNGYMLAERVKSLENKPVDGLIIPEVVNTNEKQRFIIRYLHEPNEDYLVLGEADDDIINVGDVVVTRIQYFKSLENPLHRIFAVGKDLLVMQRKHVVAVLKNHEYV